jgi:glutathione S-transferase
MNESKAILRYLGATYGYYPKDPYWAWVTDSAVEKVGEKMSESYTDAM